ncbi:phospholipase D2-like [Latimeria chalumnae]|uniref:phospholipase D2-like n=1 Tax=Latimeria chalumnae TaxID=7897 RepID=UPI0003C19DBC|nr:PREDICTED: phospholipase D2-like [Latimeria chalumnae]|eukprot:XP_006013937.1 PREDICTED: phospholipase D2-like [Latimeria chalumnae]
MSYRGVPCFEGGLISDELNPDVLQLHEDEYEYDFPKPEGRAEVEILHPFALIYQLKPLKDQTGQVFLNGVPVTARVQGTERFASGSKLSADSKRSARDAGKSRPLVCGPKAGRGEQAGGHTVTAQFQ